MTANPGEPATQLVGIPFGGERVFDRTAHPQASAGIEVQVHRLTDSRLRDNQFNDESIREIELLFLFLRAELHYHRRHHFQAEGNRTYATGPHHLGIIYILLGSRPAGATEANRPIRCDPPLFVKGFLPGDEGFLINIAGQGFCRFRADFLCMVFCDESLHLGAKGLIFGFILDIHVTYSPVIG